MIFTKKYIRQVILEEITDYVSMKNKVQSGKSKKLDNLQRDLINFFSYYRDIITDKTSIGVDDAEKNQQNFKKAIVLIKKEYNIDGTYADFLKYCINILSDAADPQLISFIRSIVIKNDKNANYSDKIDNYGMSVTPEEEKYFSGYRKDPDPGFMRVPKSDNAVDDQEDLRKFRRN